MRRSRLPLARLLCLLSILLAGAAASGGPAAAASTRQAACPTDVAVLGADMDAAQRQEVRARLGLPATATVFSESIADERSQAGGLVPRELLGVVAVSSGRLAIGPAGAGLAVRTDKTITLDTAAMYADALLVAGVRHAEVHVSAPAGAPALGTTALLGLLRAARAACLDVPAERAALAVRTLVLTSHIAQAYGSAAARTLMHDAQQGAESLAAPDEAALGAAVDSAVSRAGTPLRSVTRAALVALVADLRAAARRYPELAHPPAVQAASTYLATAATGTGIASAAALPVARYHGTVVAVGQGTLTAALPGGATRRWGHVPGQLVITRNSKTAHLADLRPGDRVSVVADSRGRMRRVTATGRSGAAAPAPQRVLSGTVLSAAAGTVAYTVTGEAAPRQMVQHAGLSVTRDGRTATLANLRPGDRVTVHLAAGGQAALVEAHSAAAGSSSAAPAPREQASPPVAVLPPVESPDSMVRQPWPVVLLIALVALGLALLSLRGLPLIGGALPFAVVERRPSSQDGAAAPACTELVRGARVVCPDGEVGRLAHVVVAPRTGALVRLIVRDREEVLREIPAHLIAGTNPSTVRLRPPWPELQAEMESQPSFSRRRYKRLPIERRRPADDAPLLQATADTLHVEIEGAPHL